jgi:hypothetical protein
MREAQRIVDGRATPLFVSLDAVARDLLGRGPHGFEVLGKPREPVGDFGEPSRACRGTGGVADMDR